MKYWVKKKKGKKPKPPNHGFLSTDAFMYNTVRGNT